MNIKLEELLGSNYYSYVSEEKGEYETTGKNNGDFIMMPVVDFAFKLLFGDYKRTERLKSLLSSILNLPAEEFEDLIIMNPDLSQDFSDDKYGRLDIRAGLKDGRQINVEIQVLPFSLMPERTVYYWAKLYSQQIKKGDNYIDLKKCITINILDYNFSLANKVHSMYHISEDKTKEYLTDVLEIHFIDLEKLRRGMGIEGIDSSLLKWLRFLAAKHREEFEMLAKNDKELQNAYEHLQEISADDRKRMEYEAREAWLMDQRTRELLARAEGKTEGIEKVARNAIKEGMDITLIARLTGLSEEKIKRLAKGDFK